jgi:23S rRNA (pseudouridine1915-N3)-methyltransferase
VQRLKHYIAIDWIIIPDIKKTIHTTIDKQKQEEGKLILEKIATSDFVLLLDDKGQSFNSENFAKFIEKKMQVVNTYLVMVIGGPYGFSEEVYKRSNGLLSLSAMTFSHQMVRLFLAEQLYRAFTIIRGEKYHHS